MGCLSLNNFYLSLFACSEEPIHSHFLCQSMHKRILSAFTRGKNHFPNYICTFLITISNNQIECLNRTTSSILWFSDKFLYNRAHISQIFRYLHLNFDPWMVFASLPVCQLILGCFFSVRVRAGVCQLGELFSRLSPPVNPLLASSREGNKMGENSWRKIFWWT